MLCNNLTEEKNMGGHNCYLINATKTENKKLKKITVELHYNGLRYNIYSVIKYHSVQTHVMPYHIGWHWIRRTSD